MKCQYCNKLAKLVNGDIIYPHRKDLYNLNFWLCEKCNAYCGCHKNTITPLGTLANSSLRKLRSECHKEFDVLWKDYNMTRTDAYKWLSEQMCVDLELCHIAMFNEEQCKNLLTIIMNSWLNDTLPFLKNKTK